MLFRSDLTVAAPVSAELIAALPRVHEIVSCWAGSARRFSLAEVVAPRRESAGPEGGGRSAFLSLGVDSTFTLTANRDVSRVLIVNGFDAWTWEREYLDRVRAGARQLLDRLGSDAPVVTVETNLRTLTDTALDWAAMAHGAGLAGIAHALARGVCEALIPASYSYRDLIPWGSHPLLDPLWSSRRLEIRHHGCGFDRVKKIACLAGVPGAVESLRVCLKYNRDRFNCGRCNKCLRTMIALRAAGALERCRTLPGEVDPGAVANIRIEGPADRIFFLELLGHLRETGSAPELLAALDAALAASGGESGAAAAARLMQAGRGKLDGRDWAGAAALFEQALECLPNNAEASYLLAFSLTAAGRDAGRALALLDAALAGGFDEFWIRYNRAALLKASGRRQEALADARRAAELDPAHGGARALLGALDRKSVV